MVAWNALDRQNLRTYYEASSPYTATATTLTCSIIHRKGTRYKSPCRHLPRDNLTLNAVAGLSSTGIDSDRAGGMLVVHDSEGIICGVRGAGFEG